MSHAAIAAALALADVNTGERLTALALASFANREQRAWPGNRLAAARAGLSVRSYLTARAVLQRRGLLSLESSGGGRGNAAVIRLEFAESGPWVRGDINAARLEAALGYSRASGAARALLAAVAALSDPSGALEGHCTEEVRSAAGLSDRSYRRARTRLLESGELQVQTGGGRGRANRWTLPALETVYEHPVQAPAARPAPPVGRPLMSSVRAYSARAPAGSSRTEHQTPTAETHRVTYVSGTGRKAALRASVGGDGLSGAWPRKGEAVTEVRGRNGEAGAGVRGRKGEAAAGDSADPGQNGTVSLKSRAVGSARGARPRGTCWPDWSGFLPPPPRTVHAVLSHTAHRRSSPSAFSLLNATPD